VAKSKAEYWLTDEGLLLLGGWARDGYTDEEIAGKMGINPSTLYEYYKKYPKIKDTIKYYKDMVDYEVEQILLEKVRSGDMTAIIFWLSNRKNKRWRRNPDNAVTEKDEEESGVILLPDVKEPESGVDV
jgi:hypothetical protein